MRSARTVFLFITLLFSGLSGTAQNELGLYSLSWSSITADTVYYPYYNDVQMIELDYLPSWQQAAEAHAWSQMYMSQATHFPDPPTNAYLFRNRSGEVVKAFNTTATLSELTAAFRTIPENRKSARVRYASSHTVPKTRFSQQGNYESMNLDFGGYYKVYNDSALKYGTAPRYFNYDRHPNGAFIGLIDSLGNVVLEMKYKAIIPLGDNILLANDTVCGVINKKQQPVVAFRFAAYTLLNAEEVVFLNDCKIGAVYTIPSAAVKYTDDYDDIAFNVRYSLRSDRKTKPDSYLLQFRKNGKTGLLDTNYNVVIPAIYDMIWSRYTEERVVCCRNGKFGYLDPYGNEVIPCVFTYTEYFRKGVGVVQYEGKFRNVDKDGKILATTTVERETWRNDQYTSNYNVGDLHAVRAISGYGLARGKEDVFVVPPIYENIYPLLSTRNRKYIASGELFIAKQYGKVGILDTAGRIILPIEYELIGENADENGFRLIRKDNDHCGLMNSRYEMVIPCIYQLIIGPYPDEHFFRVCKDGKVGTMDTTGKFIIPLVYRQINLFVNGRALAKKDTLYGFIDEKGNTLIPFQFEEVYGKFENGLAGFRRNGKWGYIDTTGKTVIEPMYDQCQPFRANITGVKLNGKWGFINRKGKLVVDYQYESVGSERYPDGTVEVKRNGMIGYVDEKGREVIPCEYTRSEGYSEGYGHWLEKDGMMRYVKK